MLRGLMLLLLPLLWVCGSVATAAEPRAFNVRDLVTLERLSDPQLSPDGRRVVYQLRQTDLKANAGKNGIWLQELSPTPKAPVRLTGTALNATTPRWSPAGDAVYFLAPHRGVAQVWRTDLTGKSMVVTQSPLDVGSFLLSPDGKRLLVSLDVFTACGEDLSCSHRKLQAQNADSSSAQHYTQLFIRHWDTWKNGTRSQLFAFALDARGRAQGAPRWLTRGIEGDVPSKPFGSDAEYAWSPDGRSVVFSARLADRKEAWSTNFDLYRVAADGSGPPENLTAQNPAWDTGPVFSKDGGTMFYRAMRRPGFEADRFAVMALDLASRQVREVNPQWDRSAESLQLAPDGRTLYLTAHHLGTLAVFAMDAASGAVTQRTSGGTVNALSVGATQLVYAKDTVRYPARLFASPLPVPADGTAQERLLVDPNQRRMAQLALGDAEQFQFKGWRGEPVYAWLVKPVGFKPDRKYPLAYLIHGGPQGSFGDQFHYRWNPQTYAGMGLAAVMVDFHGSVGYGQAFTDSISGDWGGKPLVDLQKGLRAALQRYSFLDGERVCALGGSYGGFMTNWIAGRWPKRFRCLVSHSGVFDARMMSYATEEQWFDQWERGGAPWTHPEHYERDNPVTLVSRWQTPMLVIHGQLDYRIPVEQGIAAFTALQAREVPSEFLYFPDENHWILKPANSIRWHDTVNAWLKRWLVD